MWQNTCLSLSCKTSLSQYYLYTKSNLNKLHCWWRWFNEQCIWAEIPLPSIITSITSTWVWWALWHSPKLRIYGYSLTWKAPWWQAGQVIDTITAGNLSGQLLQIRNPTCHYLIWRLDWDLGCALLECALLAAVSNILAAKSSSDCEFISMECGQILSSTFVQDCFAAAHLTPRFRLRIFSKVKSVKCLCLSTCSRNWQHWHVRSSM